MVFLAYSFFDKTASKGFTRYLPLGAVHNFAHVYCAAPFPKNKIRMALAMRIVAAVQVRAFSTISIMSCSISQANNFTGVGIAWIFFSISRK